MIRPSHPRRVFGVLASQSGLTLTEIMLVGALAILVLLGLTGFYFNAQRMWLSGSTQAMSQRDAALVVDVIGRAVHEADSAVVDASDPTLNSLELFQGNNALAKFQTESGDGRLHLYAGPGGTDRGAIAESKVSRLQFLAIDTTLVELSMIELITAQDDTVKISSRFQLLGHR